MDRCLTHGNLRPVVTEDSIGVLPARATLAELRRLCPSARRTFLAGEGAVLPALEFHLGQTTAIAAQARDSLVEQSAPDDWVVTSRDARLPLGLSFLSRWGELEAAYGSSISGAGEGPVLTMQFCRFPRLEFKLSMGSPAVVPVSAESIPDSTSVMAVVVNAQLAAPNPCLIDR